MRSSFLNRHVRGNFWLYLHTLVHSYHGILSKLSTFTNASTAARCVFSPHLIMPWYKAKVTVTDIGWQSYWCFLKFSFLMSLWWHMEVSILWCLVDCIPNVDCWSRCYILVCDPVCGTGLLCTLSCLWEVGGRERKWWGTLLAVKHCVIVLLLFAHMERCIRNPGMNFPL